MAKALIAVDLQEEYFGKDRNQEQFGDAFSNPALKRYIREKGITEIEIPGCYIPVIKGSPLIRQPPHYTLYAVKQLIPLPKQFCLHDTH